MDGMTGTEHAGIKAAVESRERQLRDELRAELAQSGNQKYADLAGPAHDAGDEAVANELMDVGNASIERHVQELRALEGARRRLVDGTINECIDCSREIGVKRLIVNPAALRCIHCQDKFEKSHGQSVSPRL
jgi:DnaK suppressor protein